MTFESNKIIDIDAGCPIAGKISGEDGVVKSSATERYINQFTEWCRNCQSPKRPDQMFQLKDRPYPVCETCKNHKHPFKKKPKK